MTANKTGLISRARGAICAAKNTTELLVKNLSRFAFLSGVVLFCGCSHVSYLIQAGIGQLSLYNHERPLREVIDDPRTPEKARERLKWVPVIKTFVENELSEKATNNYTTYVDLKRPYVIWSLTAAPAFEVRLKKWFFPIVGAFPYLGFFNEATAEDWARDYRSQGFDTYVRGVRAYSTLGYLRDPLLSTMLSREKRDLVNLIFHETAHSYIFIKGEGSFNEEAASFVGDYGERLWLVQNYGSRSAELNEWKNERQDRRLFGDLLRRFSDELKIFYRESSDWNPTKRTSVKEAKFAAFRVRVKTTRWMSHGGTAEHLEKLAASITNNAALLAYLTYEDDQDVFDTLNEKCGGRLKDVLRFLKRYSSDWEKGGSSRSTDGSPQSVLRERLQAPAFRCAD